MFLSLAVEVIAYKPFYALDIRVTSAGVNTHDARDLFLLKALPDVQFEYDAVSVGQLSENAENL